jgi:hypothetical protein
LPRHEKPLASLLREGGFSFQLSEPAAPRNVQTTCGSRAVNREEMPVEINIVTLQPIIALIAGVLILIMPRLLNFIVAIYLIFIGLSGLLGTR